MRRIGVIGGGLAGLTVAYRRVGAGDAVVVFEPLDRLGGQLWTERRDGFVVEHGAEGFVARSEAVPVLAASLGIEGDLVGQEETQSYGFDGARLVPLAPGEAATFLGFQVPRDELGKGIRAFRHGMGQLSDALEGAIQGRAAVRLGSAVTTVTAAGARWSVAFEDGSAEEVDQVVVATTAATAAAILGASFGDSARALRQATTLSSCTVTLAWPREAIGHPLDGTGFVVAAAHQEHGFRACTFITSKFFGRAPEGQVSLRVFFRPEAEDLAGLADQGWINRAVQSLARVLPVHAPPARAWVSRWASALPVFDPGHTARVRALEAALAGRGVLLAGAACHS